MASPADSKLPIRASLADYKGRPVIRLDFTYDITIISEVRAIRGRTWSVTNKCWYVPDTSENRRRFGISAFENVQGKPGESTYDNPYALLCQSLLDRVREKIQLKGYSPQTLKSYQHHLRKFLNSIANQKNPLEVTKEDIHRMLISRNGRIESVDVYLNKGAPETA